MTETETGIMTTTVPHRQTATRTAAPCAYETYFAALAASVGCWTDPGAYGRTPESPIGTAEPHVETQIARPASVAQEDGGSSADRQSPASDPRGWAAGILVWVVSVGLGLAVVSAAAGHLLIGLADLIGRDLPA
jgi:hypothetical protein